VRVDATGVGFNFALHLLDCRFPVDPVNVAMVCEGQPQLKENDPARRFVNLKACFYQTLADAFERDLVEGLVDDGTIGQLSGILYEIDSHGRMKIESKERARARGVSSPDRAEALMLALSKPPWKVEYYPVRDLPAEQSPSGGPAGEDYDDSPLRGRGRWEGWAPGTLARQLSRRSGAW
jgi:hypothetical protein